MTNISTERLEEMPVKGEGFERETGGFAVIHVGERTYTAGQIRQAVISLDKGEVVKPLEWTHGRRIQYKKFDGVIHSARCEQTSLAYSIWHYVEWQGPQFLWHGKSTWFETLEQAKAAAQADYETRIRSALVSQPAPKGVEIEEEENS